MDTNYNKNNTALSSVEIGSLWNSYIIQTMTHHIFSYFSNNIDDSEIKTCVDLSKITTASLANEFREVFQKENLPVPRGTTSEDINIKSPRLFTDFFYMRYIKELSRFALLNYSMGYTQSIRDDIRQLFKRCLIRIQETDQVVSEVMFSKGIYNMPPQVTVPNEIDFVEKENFFAGYFGHKRPLTVLEINQLFYNARSNMLGKALMIGFSQVSKSKEAHDYFIKGKDIADKYVKIFSDKLQDENVAIPHSMESEVLPVSSGQSPFSDRLMLNHTIYLNTYGIGNYGLSLSQSQRRDLSVMYVKILEEVGLYADDGADLMIKNKWLEQPPTTPKRENLYSMN